MEVHGFTETGMIDATIDGVRWTVPDNAESRHRQAIKAWEKAGNIIPPYVAPAAILPALTPRQMLLALLSIGITQTTVEDQLLQIQDEDERARAMIEWQSAGAFERNHPTIALVAAALDLPAAQVDALWVWASTL